MRGSGGGSGGVDGLVSSGSLSAHLNILIDLEHEMDAAIVPVVDHSMVSLDVDLIGRADLQVIGSVHDEKSARIGLDRDVHPKAPSLHVRADAVPMGSQELHRHHGRDHIAVELFCPKLWKIKTPELKHHTSRLFLEAVPRWRVHDRRKADDVGIERRPRRLWPLRQRNRRYPFEHGANVDALADLLDEPIEARHYLRTSEGFWPDAGLGCFFFGGLGLAFSLRCCLLAMGGILQLFLERGSLLTDDLEKRGSWSNDARREERSSQRIRQVA